MALKFMLQGKHAIVKKSRGKSATDRGRALRRVADELKKTARKRHRNRLARFSGRQNPKGNGLTSKVLAMIWAALFAISNTLN